MDLGIFGQALINSSQIELEYSVLGFSTEFYRGRKTGESGETENLE